MWMAGCGLQKVTVQTDGSKPIEVRQYQLTDDQKISLLRAEAKKRGLKWRVICESGEEDRFVGWAVKAGEPWGIYAEEGVTGFWMEHEASSQADAALQLYRAIQHPPSLYHRDPEPPPSQHVHKICPPELRGE